MKKILSILALVTLMSSCSLGGNGKAESLDRSTPQKVLNGYAEAMKTCDLTTGVEYFEPALAATLKVGYGQIINGTIDGMQEVAQTLGKTEESDKIQKQQDIVNAQLASTGSGKVDLNKICKASKLEITDFSLLDNGEISGDNAKFKVSFTSESKKNTEDWRLIKIGNDWFLLDSKAKTTQNKEDASVNHSQSSSGAELSTWAQSVGLDITKFSKDQSDQIQNGLDSKINPSIYAKSEFTPDQMQEIRYGLEAWSKAEIYANPEFNIDQMREIRYGLKAWVKAEIYANPEFSTDQMKEVRYGLESGIDVTSYAKSDFSVDQMQEARHSLEK